MLNVASAFSRRSQREKQRHAYRHDDPARHKPNDWILYRNKPSKRKTRQQGTDRRAGERR